MLELYLFYLQLPLNVLELGLTEHFIIWLVVYTQLLWLIDVPKVMKHKIEYGVCRAGL
jgi:hypothetical protein